MATIPSVILEWMGTTTTSNTHSAQITAPKPWLVVVTGPTASGKTSLAINLAQSLQTSILSFDSRQFYSEMPIGTAQPIERERQNVFHWGIGARSIDSPYSAGAFQRDAIDYLKHLFESQSVVVAVGGSTLYYDALCHGLDNFPEIGEETKTQVAQIFEHQGLQGWRDALKKLDPATFSNIDLQNPRRLQRALEVCVESGKPYASFLNMGSQELPYHTLSIAPIIERKALYERIDQRVLQMVANGLEDEARGLYEKRHLSTLDTVGYREWWAYFEGQCELEEVISLIQRNTRRYAKRQLTWFRKKADLHWMDFGQTQDILNFIHEKITG